MSRKRLPADDPHEWIGRAKSNLAVARSIIPNVDLEDFCFEAQQAAEKGIKAVFTKRGERFPFSHDLDKLLRLLEGNGVRIPKYVNAAKHLTHFAHLTRYPGMADPVTKREYRRALQRTPLALLLSGGPSPDHEHIRPRVSRYCLCAQEVSFHK